FGAWDLGFNACFGDAQNIYDALYSYY
ncbi:MAG: hypothetical protein HW384_1442, partial [Dehalococcoidia bacterium]|nr:hypothetical protein [Dehalococcoidia bacterium]